ncbi:MAG TPA: hypothetical protein P5183_04460 [Smithellaceae bacterium]|nr:hypothetical protein [Smithellaceae bacterium]
MILSFLISCGIIPTVKPPEEQYPLLGKTYKKIILQKFEIDQDLEREFPDAVVTCESTTMSELLKRNAAPIIEKARLSTSKDPTALIIKTRIITLKMASASPRGISGEFTMTAEVRIIDAQARKILRKNILSSADLNPNPADTTFNERTMPAEFGKMIAEYIANSLSGN